MAIGFIIYVLNKNIIIDVYDLCNLRRRAGERADDRQASERWRTQAGVRGPDRGFAGRRWSERACADWTKVLPAGVKGFAGV